MNSAIETERGPVTVRIVVEDVSGIAGTPPAADLRRWARAALRGTRDEGELVIRVVDEAESAALNSTYRHKAGATNVLSFPAELPAGVPVAVLGDLVICAPVVQREALEQGKSPQAHWAHMVVHGCLHLLGFDHVTDRQAAEMEPLEGRLLAALGFPDPYAPR